MPVNGLGFQSPGQSFAQGLNIASTIAGLQQRKALHDQDLGLIKEQRLREKGEDDATKAYSSRCTHQHTGGRRKPAQPVGTMAKQAERTWRDLPDTAGHKRHRYKKGDW